MNWGGNLKESQIIQGNKLCNWTSGCLIRSVCQRALGVIQLSTYQIRKLNQFQHEQLDAVLREYKLYLTYRIQSRAGDLFSGSQVVEVWTFKTDLEATFCSCLLSPAGGKGWWWRKSQDVTGQSFCFDYFTTVTWFHQPHQLCINTPVQPLSSRCHTRSAGPAVWGQCGTACKDRCPPLTSPTTGTNHQTWTVDESDLMSHVFFCIRDFINLFFYLFI